MASVVRQFMQNSVPAKQPVSKTHTRPHRRKTVNEIIILLNNILDGELAYRDNIPEQFEARYGAAEQVCDKLSEAIECLEEAFNQ